MEMKRWMQNGGIIMCKLKVLILTGEMMVCPYDVQIVRVHAYMGHYDVQSLFSQPRSR